MDYVAGFLFSDDREYLALVEKIKPDWQRGYLNGVGGKIESPDASPEYAMMIREFEEETGWRVPDWEPFCEMRCYGDLIAGCYGKLVHIPVIVDFAGNGYLIPPFDGYPNDTELRKVVEAIRQTDRQNSPE